MSVQFRNSFGELFTCAWCRQEFQKGRTDEEALAEARKRLPALDLKASDLVLICEWCNQGAEPVLKPDPQPSES
jgi:hypothetical protein